MIGVLSREARQSLEVYRPEGLDEEYTFNTPDTLLINAPLSQAVRATEVMRAIDEKFNFRPFTQMDPDLHMAGWEAAQLDSKSLRINPYTRIREDREPKRLAASFGKATELLFVNEARKLDPLAVLYLGRATGDPQIERVYYLGTEKSLGKVQEPLAEFKKFEVIQDPLEVYRWQTPEGLAIKMTFNDTEGEK